MAIRVDIEGMQEFQNNISKLFPIMEGYTTAGFIRAAIVIQRGTEDGSTKVPVDTGNLRASWYVVANDGVTMPPSPMSDSETEADTAKSILTTKGNVAGAVPQVGFGYGANYAVDVHEATELNFQRPGSGAKWLEKSIVDNKNEILKEIAGVFKM